MDKTPAALRRHIAITGKVNAGKSTLFNQLLGQDAAIVSDTAGTTTDPVIRAMELIPYGPIMVIDTAGNNDDTGLSSLRQQRTDSVLRRVSLVIHAVSAQDEDIAAPGFSPSITMFTKCDLVSDEKLARLKSKYPDAVFDLNELKVRLVSTLTKMDEGEQDTLVGDLVAIGGRILLVTPIDSEAPKGRLILPQVQVIRDCLDHGIISAAVRETELSSALSFAPDLVITDSKVFGQVAKILPPDMPLTSFSMVVARQKGGFKTLIDGAKKISTLKKDAHILISEGCTHTTNHEDIGTVIIPKALKTLIGESITFTHMTGYDIPESLDSIDLVVQCGGCMTAKAEVENRIKTYITAGIPVTNYGCVLALASGILDRAAAPLLA